MNHSPYNLHGPHDPDIHHPAFGCHGNSLHNSHGNSLHNSSRGTTIHNGSHANSIHTSSHGNDEHTGSHGNGIHNGSHGSSLHNGHVGHGNHTGGMAVYGVCHTKQKLVVCENNHMRTLAAEDENSSMLAQADLNRDEEFSLVENDVEMIEDQVPLPNAIFRAQNQMMNIPSLVSPDIDIAHEEEVSTSTSEDFSSGDSELGALSNGVSYYRLISEECNANQPRINSCLKKGYACKKMTNIPKSASDYDVPSVPLPLENLKRLANLPQQYMPEQAYKTFVAEQKVDNSQKVKPGREERSSFATCNPSRSTSSTQADGSDSRRVSPKLKNGLINPPKTFPMRVKPQCSGVTISELREQHEKTATITKSMSLPNDMKPEIFRKGRLIISCILLLL